MPGATTFDRVIVTAVALLIAAFTLGALGPLVTPASGDNVSGARDDEAPDVALIDEEDDDGDDPLARGDDTDGDSGNSNSGSRSIGSRSGNTRTGTTNGTGISKTVSNSSDASKNTKTGTSRGTGRSATISNSS
jgi:hypothetical protein